MTGAGTYRSNALVQRKTKLKETDLIVTFLKEDGALARAVAHGARKPSSSFAARLEPGAVVDALFARGRSLDVVKEVRNVAPHASLRADFDRSAALAPVVELAGKVAVESLENPRLFLCATAALDAMESADVLGCRALSAACLLKELAFAGFRPALAHCAVCGDVLSFAARQVAFSAREGGCLCAMCAAGTASAHVHPAPSSACAFARDLLHRPFSDVDALLDGRTAAAEDVKGALRLAQELVEEHVGTRLKSVGFLLSTWA